MYTHLDLYLASFEVLALPQRFLKLSTLFPLKILYFSSDWFHSVKVPGDNLMHIVMRADGGLKVEDWFGLVFVKVQRFLSKTWERNSRPVTGKLFLSEIIFYLYFYKISILQLILGNQNSSDRWSHFYSKVTQYVSPYSSLCFSPLGLCLHMVGD